MYLSAPYVLRVRPPMTQMPAPTTERMMLMLRLLRSPSSESVNLVCTPTALLSPAMTPAGARKTPIVASMRAIMPITAPPGGQTSVVPTRRGSGMMIHGP